MNLINLEIVLKFRKECSLSYKMNPVRIPYLESSQIHTQNKQTNWLVSVQSVCGRGDEGEEKEAAVVIDAREEKREMNGKGG